MVRSLVSECEIELPVIERIINNDPINRGVEKLASGRSPHLHNP